MNDDQRREQIRSELLDYVTPVLFFHDDRTGRDCVWAHVGGESWLLYNHPDGQWVTWRRTTERDREKLLAAISDDPTTVFDTSEPSDA